MSSDRVMFYSSKTRSHAQMMSDSRILDRAVERGDIVSLAIAVLRKDGVYEITWSGERTVGLAKCCESLAEDILRER